MPGVTYHRTNGVGGKQKHSTRLAVSVRVGVPYSWTNINLRDCLNYNLKVSSGTSGRIVICEQLKHGNDRDNEYYVELRTQSDRNRLLELNGTRIDSAGHTLWPVIQVWDRDPPVKSPLKQYDKYGNSDPWKQHQHQKNVKKNLRGNAGESPKEDVIDGNCGYRPSKRAKMHEGENSINCKIFLSRNPDGFVPESFRDYFNRHLKQTNINGVSDSVDGKPLILKCYESSTPTIHDGWVLETNTKYTADIIMNHVNGKLVLSGTRLYFQRQTELLRVARMNTPPSPSIRSLSTNHSSNKEQFYSPSSSSSSSSFYPRKDYERMVYISKIPESMSLKEVTSFINTSMRKAKLLDHDVIIESKRIGKLQRTCVFRCISANAAKSTVDELNDASLENIKLKLRRHNKIVHQQQGNRANIEIENEDAVSSDWIRDSPKDSVSNRSASLNNMSLSHTSTSRRKQATRSTDKTTTSRFVFLSTRGNDKICLSKVMSFLDEAIAGESYKDCDTFIGVERHSSSCYRFETDTEQTASELVNLSGIMYDKSIELILKKYEVDNSIHIDLAMEDQPTAFGNRLQSGHPIHTPAVTDVNGSFEANSHADSALLEVNNKNLTKQVMKLLKENKDLKKQNERLAAENHILQTEQIGSGSHNEPIELEDSGDEGGEVTNILKKNGLEQFDEIKRESDIAASELGKIKADKTQLENELITVKDTCKDLERKVEEAKREVVSDYERRLHEIHESWREQNVQIEEQQETIVSLNVGMKELTAKKERLDSELEDIKKRYQEMTDALTLSTVMVREEQAVRKSMTLSLVELRKAKKRAQKELKKLSRIASVKNEDKYDA